jgi:hypothetical protein
VAEEIDALTIDTWLCEADVEPTEGFVQKIIRHRGAVSLEASPVIFFRQTPFLKLLATRLRLSEADSRSAVNQTPSVLVNDYSDRLLGMPALKESVLEKRRKEDNSQTLLERGWYHSFDLPGIGAINGLISLDDLENRWASMPLPADLTGKRVLDIGTWDG